MRISAAPLTFLYSAEITQVNLDLNDPLVGSLVTGSYTFDSSAPDDSGDPTYSSYTFTGPPFGMAATISGSSFVTNDFLNILAAEDVDGNLTRYVVSALS